MENIQTSNIIPLWSDGEIYYINSDQIYIPAFAKPKEDKNDTESKEENKG